MSQYRPDVDGLRAVAIIPVVLFHAGFSAVRGGFVGVDIFFVISGYLITLLILSDIEAGTFSISRFWIRRARRILPAALLVLLFSLVAGWFILLPDDFKRAGQSAVAQAFFVSNVFFWSRAGYFGDPAEAMPLLHTWSLSVEEQFYLVFPLLLLALTRYATAWRAQIVAAILCISFVLSVWAVSRQPEAAFYFLHFRAWELLLGSAVAFAVNRKLSIPAPELMSWTGAALIAVAITQYDRTTRFPGAAALLPCVGAALVIWANAGRLTSVGRVLALRPLVAIGLISYSVYLWHWPILMFAKYASSGPLSMPHILALLALTVLLAAASYKLVETPIRRVAVLRRTPLFISAACAAIVLAAVAGMAVHVRGGFPDRLPGEVYAAYQRAFDVGNVCATRAVQPLFACTQAAAAGPPDLIVWGDSHAERVMPAVQELAARRGVVAWRHSCVPILGAYTVGDGASLRSSSCYGLNTQMLEYIKRAGVKHVLMVAYWSLYTEGGSLELEGPTKKDPFYAVDAPHSSGRDEARRIFSKQFPETIRTLRDLGVTVWIMREVPSHRYWVPNQVAKLARFGAQTPDLGRPRSEYSARTQFIDTVFREAQAQGARVLDPTPAFCDDSFCRASEGSQPLYSDYNHVNARGSMKLRPALATMFREITPRL